MFLENSLLYIFNKILGEGQDILSTKPQKVGFSSTFSRIYLSKSCPRYLLGSPFTYSWTLEVHRFLLGLGSTYPNTAYYRIYLTYSGLGSKPHINTKSLTDHFLTGSESDNLQNTYFFNIKILRKLNPPKW